MYAEDCILYKSGNNWDRMVNNVQLDLNNVHSWCSRNRLKLNESKSKVLLFGSIAKLSHLDYSQVVHIGDVDLGFVERYKYLGVNLDKYMNLSGLLSDVKKNVIGQLFKLENSTKK